MELHKWYRTRPERRVGSLYGLVGNHLCSRGIPTRVQPASWPVACLLNRTLTSGFYDESMMRLDENTRPIRYITRLFLLQILIGIVLQAKR